MLWKRLYSWLPEAFGDRELAYANFAWVNLSVTAGGSELGTDSSHHEGLVTHLVPFVEAAHARIVAGTNEPVMRQLRRWTAQEGAVPVAADGLECVQVDLTYGPVLVAKVGHPSRGVSRTEFVRRIELLLDLARSEHPLSSNREASPREVVP